MGPLSNEMEGQTLESDDTMEEESGSRSAGSSTSAGSESSSSYTDFVELDEVSIPSINATRPSSYRGTQRIQILHKNVMLQLYCPHLKVRFGISTKFVDRAGRPRLNIVLDATPNLCQVLDACDSLVQKLFAQKLSVDSRSRSEWRPVVNRKSGYVDSPTVRVHIPTVEEGNTARWTTEIYEKESSASPQRLIFSRFDVEEIDTLFTPGTFVDSYLCLQPYGYQQNAGIRLVAKKLIVHS